MGKNIRGAGDVVAAITKFAGIEPCEACKKRQEKWNRIFPSRIRKNIRQMTEEEVADWKSFQEVRTLRLTNEQRKYVCTIYAEVFNVPYYEPCATCDPLPYLRMIEKMDSIIKTYDPE
ncbi:hypothetical protein [Flavobacterium album]|uniref:hypothetical protein n=1 Tax=Flavobacterium album TaxID=2175091 RepID=UPI0011B1F343|nr:hypothetical protein [Flavobacterium album]